MSCSARTSDGDSRDPGARIVRLRYALSARAWPAVELRERSGPVRCQVVRQAEHTRCHRTSSSPTRPTTTTRSGRARPGGRSGRVRRAGAAPPVRCAAPGCRCVRIDGGGEGHRAGRVRQGLPVARPLPRRGAGALLAAAHRRQRGEERVTRAAAGGAGGRTATSGCDWWPPAVIRSATVSPQTLEVDRAARPARPPRRARPRGAGLPVRGRAQRGRDGGHARRGSRDGEVAHGACARAGQGARAPASGGRPWLSSSSDWPAWRDADVPRADTLVDDVLAEIACRHGDGGEPLLAAAAVLLVVAVGRGGRARHPPRRRQMARVRVAAHRGRRSHPAGARCLTLLRQPIVIIETLPGRLDDGLYVKLVESGVQITQVDVAGRLGYWITGEPHVLMYRDADGDVREARTGSRHARVAGRRRHPAHRGRHLPRPRRSRSPPAEGDAEHPRVAFPACPTPRFGPRCSRWRRCPPTASASSRRSSRPYAAATRT